MPNAVTFYTLQTGETQYLEMLSDEDHEFRFTFTDATFADTASATMYIMLDAARLLQITGSVFAIDTLSFTVTQVNAGTLTVGTRYDCGAQTIDTAGHKTLQLGVSRFLVLDP